MSTLRSILLPGLFFLLVPVLETDSYADEITKFPDAIAISTTEGLTINTRLTDLDGQNVLVRVSSTGSTI